jgi:integrase
MANQSNNPRGVGKHGRRQRSPKAARYIPDADFPLSVHLPSGRYYKTVKGQRHYFGRLADGPGPAMETWLVVKDELVSGLTPVAWKTDDNATVADVVNAWLQAQSEKSESGDILPRTFTDYFATCKVVADVLGRDTRVKDLLPDQFARLGAKFKRDQSPTAAAKSITVAKMPFRWAFENARIPAVVRFGTDFKMPRKAERRAASLSRGKAIYTAGQVRKLIRAAERGVTGKRWKRGGNEPAGVAPSKQLLAMILLGVNGGMTQAEVSALTLADTDLDAGIINTIRAKAGVERVIPLWDETVSAIVAALAEQGREDAGADERVFLTKAGNPWVREEMDQIPDPNRRGMTVPRLRKTDSVNLQFRKLSKAVGVDVKGAAFGHLRHTFRTIADECNDINAARRIMGQELVGIDAHYVKTMKVERLKLVTDHVRAWLFDD